MKKDKKRVRLAAERMSHDTLADIYDRAESLSEPGIAAQISQVAAAHAKAQTTKVRRKPGR